MPTGPNTQPNRRRRSSTQQAKNVELKFARARLIRNQLKPILDEQDISELFGYTISRAMVNYIELTALAKIARAFEPERLEWRLTK